MELSPRRSLATISTTPRKRSAAVALGLGLLAGCGRQITRAPDPCVPQTFHQTFCEEAVRNQGYYSRGVFIPHIYPLPYPYYFGNYGSYVSSGGSVSPASANEYSATPGRT